MNDAPNLSSYGYDVIDELGYNRAEARATYKVRKEGNFFIVKRFYFPRRLDDFSSWDKAYKKELETLGSLDHPNIPKVVEHFELRDDSRCIVLEYMPGRPLSKQRSFGPDQIKIIVVRLLEILVYLQEERVPSIIHKDIKPENIIVDETSENLSVYLVDFGFSRLAGKNQNLSSMVKGTEGYRAPEQLRKRSLTKASDLYGTGATIVCLVTGIKSTDIDHFIDTQNRIKFRDSVPDLGFRFIEWLEKMVEPDPSKRYANAVLALEAVEGLYVKRTPKITVENEDLNKKSCKLGEQIVCKVEVSNDVPETTIQGRWSVREHPADPHSFIHPWIKFSDVEIDSNKVTTKVLVDTSKLMAARTYKRELLFHNNSLEGCKTFELKVKTAPIPNSLKYPNLGWLMLLLSGSFFTSLNFKLASAFMGRVFSALSSFLDSMWLNFNI